MNSALVAGNENAILLLICIIEKSFGDTGAFLVPHPLHFTRPHTTHTLPHITHNARRQKPSKAAVRVLERDCGHHTAPTGALYLCAQNTEFVHKGDNGGGLPPIDLFAIWNSGGGFWNVHAGVWFFFFWRRRWRRRRGVLGLENEEQRERDGGKNAGGVVQMEDMMGTGWGLDQEEVFF